MALAHLLDRGWKVGADAAVDGIDVQLTTSFRREIERDRTIGRGKAVMAVARLHVTGFDTSVGGGDIYLAGNIVDFYASVDRRSFYLPANPLNLDMAVDRAGVDDRFGR